MKNPGKISFCVTFYNQAKFVRQSLDSILNMNIPCDYEILIGDDGSADETVNIVEQYIIEYPNIISLYVMPRDKNTHYNSIQRASANRLNLVSHSTGDYIMFLDGDDYFCSDDFVEDALNVFHNNKGTVACAFNFTIKNKHSALINNVFKGKAGFLNTWKFIKNGGYIHVGAIVFKNIFDKMSIEKLANTEDFDDCLITFYVFQFGEVYFVDKSIYVYRQNENGIWSSSSNIEQHLINAIDYNIISSVAPIFTKSLRHRYSYDIRHVFLHRRELKTVLNAQKTAYIKSVLKKTNNNLMLSVFNYDILSLYRKFLTRIKIFLGLY